MARRRRRTTKRRKAPTKKAHLTVGKKKQVRHVIAGLKKLLK